MLKFSRKSLVPEGIVIELSEVDNTETKKRGLVDNIDYHVK